MENRKLEAVKMFLENGVDVNVQNKKGWAPISQYFRNFQASKDRSIMQWRFLLNVLNVDGSTTLLEQFHSFDMIVRRCIVKGGHLKNILTCEIDLNSSL